MNRRTLFGALTAAVAAAAVPMAALAQLPPAPPAVFWGTAASIAVGSDVVAMVGDGNSFVACGAGKVLQDGANPVYVVQVITEEQRPGCGRSGRTIRFYIGPSGATAGRLANESASWQGAGPRQLNITAGGSLQARTIAALVASDKK
jgi:hypothetical protein